MIRRRVVAALVVLVLARAAAAETPVPSVTGPITGPGAPFVASTSFDVTPLGYVEQEFFLAGTARAFTSPAPLGSDGQWTAVPGATDAFNTRILVRRPVDSREFNGTVVVEWLNVSGGLDAAPDWIFAHTYLMREGFAWVGVSAQRVGIEGGGGIPGLNLSLKAQNPARYGGLVHPGDSFSYDIFSQVATALRAGNPRPLGVLEPKRLVAIGESQSAFRLVTYVNAIHPLDGLYDGYFIHSRGNTGAALSQAPQPAVNGPGTAFIRADVDVPVLTFETETDLVVLGFLPARQPDTPKIRLWELAGAAHGDLYQLILGFSDQGPAALDITYAPPTSAPIPGIITCGSPVNQGPQHYVVSAALAALDRWVRGGRAPRRMPRLEIQGNTFVTDTHGNVRGGIRTPQQDVPIAKYSGLGQSGSAFCGLFGTTIPFDGADLAFLYATHARYVAAVKRATRRAVRRGVVLPLDARAIVAAAAASTIGD